MLGINFMILRYIFFLQIIKNLSGGMKFLINVHFYYKPYYNKFFI